jgi:hypothetical protein
MKCVHGREVGGIYGGECWECEEEKSRHREIVEAIGQLGRPEEKATGSTSSFFGAIENFITFMGMGIGALAGGIYGLVEGFKDGGIGPSLGWGVAGIVIGGLTGTIFGALLGGLLPLLLLGALVYAFLRLFGN